MNFHILTLFPELIEAGMNTSIIGRAVKAGFISFEAVDIRAFSNEPHRKVDDYPYGGGAGMVMQAQPVYDAWRSVVGGIGGFLESGSISAEVLKEEPDGTPAHLNPLADMPVNFPPKIRTLYTSPAGRVFNQEFARELAGAKGISEFTGEGMSLAPSKHSVNPKSSEGGMHIIILCGHYEGIDERALRLIGAEEVSIGDYVLTGGELAALVIADAVSRMVPGVLTNEESGTYESFSVYNPKEENFTKRQMKDVYGEEIDRSIKLLEYPQYTRPAEFMGLKVPEVLLSGNHAEIEVWRRKQSLERTLKRRPDLL